MEINQVERVIGWLGGLAALVTLGAIFLGIWRGVRRASGRTVGWVPGLLKSQVFYILGSAAYFGFCYYLWKPLPFALSGNSRRLALVAGALVYFAGLGLALWGRLALGRQYFVSTSIGAQLFAGHQLVTHGPYRLVRHPMYLGIILVGIGGILLYRTSTLVWIFLTGLGLVLRAHREEQALAAEFREQWQVYCRKTPRWFPLPRSAWLAKVLVSLRPGKPEVNMDKTIPPKL